MSDKVARWEEELKSEISARANDILTPSKKNLEIPMSPDAAPPVATPVRLVHDHEHALKQVLEDYVCVSCNNLSKKPVSFPCGCCACAVCLKDLNAEVMNPNLLSIACCPKHPESAVPLKNTRINEHIIHKIETTARMLRAEEEAMKSEDVICENCSERLATLRCIECSGFLCQTCSGDIHKLNMFKNHNVVDIADQNVVQINVGLPEEERIVFPANDFIVPTHCDAHSKMYSYYCADCVCLVCPDCCMDTHSHHQIVDLGSASNLIQKQFGVARKHISSTFSKMASHLHELHDAENATEERLRERIEQITFDVAKMIDLLKVRQAELIRDVMSEEFSHLEQNDEEKELFYSNINILKKGMAALRKADEYVEQQDTFNFVYCFTIMNDALQNLNLFEDIIEDQFAISTGFDKGEVLAQILEHEARIPKKRTADKEEAGSLAVNSLVHEIMAYQMGNATLQNNLSSFGLGVNHSFPMLSSEHAIQLQEWLGQDNKWRPIYNAENDGFSASIFHQKCDNRGPTVTIVYTPDGAIFGGFTPVPWGVLLDSHPDASGTSFLFSLCRPGAKQLGTNAALQMAQDDGVTLSTSTGRRASLAFKDKRDSIVSNTKSYLSSPGRSPKRLKRDKRIADRQRERKRVSDLDVQRVLNKPVKLVVRHRNSAVFHRSSHGPCFGGMKNDHDLYITHNANVNGGYAQLGLSYAFPGREVCPSQKEGQFFFTGSHHFKVKNVEVYTLIQE
ncbi:hypothetical protein PCE1_001367 [Barthelona sp. PCE]